MSDDKIVQFPKPIDTEEKPSGFIEVSYTVDPEDMDAASFCLGAAAVGLNIGANISNEAVMHAALCVAAQAALTAGYSADQFRSICSTIDFLGTPPKDVC
jgi:hypothetical protein